MSKEWGENKEFNDAAEKYDSTAEKFNNGEAYKQAIQNAQTNAQGMGAAMGAQANRNAQTAALNSNMSKGQAAIMGADQANQAFGQGFTTGAQSGLQASTAMQQSGLNAQGQGAQMQQQEGKNRYDRTWGGVNTALSSAASIASAFSDERTKDATQNNKSSNIDEILKRHQKPIKCDFKSLLSTKEEKSNE